MKIWIPINGTQQCGIGSPKIHGLSTGPPGLGRHNLVSELRYTNMCDMFHDTVLYVV